ncbi:heat-inducible transcriptional repressor HrcA [Clostridium sp. 'White wine YQ']|uniref:heat-inducible transcriptional repressor HrcA n=1 Tax=Clostridium sp. 'White wine YQ' TaxID=3027474 RepID=UPI002366E4FE|nr:heat-inducible transcriptional repressor HrcA [Clostridium sp. 'White wine YQ']MDD7794545.1 heat-inducible transcriptional repressor HrcA [Clostridium sp. 'White wine YQ']
MSIDDRKIRILQAIINDYVKTAEPVGSRTLSKKYDLGISSATIRNEMADLEEMGYLEQPHASAGRVPSSKGYRLYVDKLMEYKTLSTEEELMIKKYIIDMALFEVDKVLKQTSTLLSELTRLTCVVKAPSVKKSYMKSAQLVKIDDFNVLCIIVTDNGVVKNGLLRVSRSLSPEVLNKINNILNERLVNLTIEEINLEVINRLTLELKGFDEILNGMLSLLYETLKSSNSSEVFMEGTTNIFNYSEYNDIERAKEILELLYNKEYVNELITTDKGISIKIGDENFLPQAKDCSVITAEYTLGERPLGTIGLIGPRRIDYSKVISIMAEVMKELNTLFNKQSLK